MAEHLVAGKTAFYEKIGSGPPLAIVHGGLGQEHTYFRPWLDALAERNTLVFVDLMGNGSSDDPEGLDELDNLQPWVDQLDALRRHLGYERWTVLGHSFGGLIVQTYASQHGADLDGLIVCCSTAIFDHAEESFAAAKKLSTPEQFEAMTERLLVQMEDDAHYARVWREVHPVYFAHPERYDFESMSRVRLRAGSYNAAVRILPTIDLREALPGIDVPVLVQSATMDWTFPPEVGGKRIASLLPNATYVEFEDSGHEPFIEENEKFLRTTGEWLAALAR